MQDQLVGGEEGHEGLREEVCEFMDDNKDDFAPFVEEDESWDGYIERMREPGEWGGNLELQAVSRLKQVNVAVHQPGTGAPFLLRNFDSPEAIHLAYACSDHYDSVRPPMSDLAKPGGPFSLPEEPPSKDALRRQKVAMVLDTMPEGSEQRAREALDMSNGDVSNAVELVLAWGMDDGESSSSGDDETAQRRRTKANPGGGKKSKKNQKSRRSDSNQTQNQNQPVRRSRRFEEPSRTAPLEI